jgi:hypothetical protein
MVRRVRDEGMIKLAPPEEKPDVAVPHKAIVCCSYVGVKPLVVTVIVASPAVGEITVTCRFALACPKAMPDIIKIAKNAIKNFAFFIIKIQQVVFLFLASILYKIDTAKLNIFLIPVTIKSDLFQKK